MTVTASIFLWIVSQKPDADPIQCISGKFNHFSKGQLDYNGINTVEELSKSYTENIYQKLDRKDS